ncbi:MAG: hypothetical protein NTZ03_15255 [Actinobacteria bacterium]|nr:hypothetical protein [Actinomycetota bacterium]
MADLRERLSRALVRSESGTVALPNLRWSIRIASHPDRRGDVWGDTHFAASLQRALVGLGQIAYVDRRGAPPRVDAHTDEVVLVIRGLHAVELPPDVTSMIWLISHPDTVPVSELATYDHVFVASAPWEESLRSKGIDARVLLQATEPTIFHPDLEADENSGDIVFVGRPRGVYRPVLRACLEAGIEPVIYGDGWEAFDLGRLVRSTYLPAEQTARVYATAAYVLNDHWSDMAEKGFISNRLFDAVATGARVISDDVAELDETFGGAVQVFRSPDDVLRLTDPANDAFPSREERLRIAATTARDHSFDARALELIAAAATSSGN